MNEKTIARVQLASENLTLCLLHKTPDEWTILLDYHDNEGDDYTGIVLSLARTKEAAMAHAKVVLTEALNRLNELNL